MARLVWNTLGLGAAALPLIMLGACAVDSTDETSEAPPGFPEGPGICMPNTCASDQECGSCTDGRNTCLVAENRCVGCDPNTGAGCDEGMACSSWGICAPEGQVCTTGPDGLPDFICTQDSDCLACSPMHQICGPEGRCQACTTVNTSHCSSADLCADGQCSPKCPAQCAADADCFACGGPGNEAHACNQGTCAQCSDTFPCPPGHSCEHGTCAPHCGAIGLATGECTADEDCGTCGSGEVEDSWTCKKLGPNEPQGTCIPMANGCSDLGDGTVLLPAPYDEITQTCSNDGDCIGISADYNVGELVRDLVGDSIDLGFVEVEIKDAYIQYAMGDCASVDIAGDVSCGVCVPCQVRSDCSSIPLDPLIWDLFRDDPLAGLAGTVLLDLLFGFAPSHDLHFYCQPVAAGFGACVPCGNPLSPC